MLFKITFIIGRKNIYMYIKKRKKIIFLLSKFFLFNSNIRFFSINYFLKNCFSKIPMTGINIRKNTK